ncbi:MAG: hypothetical protein QQN41_13895, partial [Nitrosopumilus sp.]
MKAKFVYEAMGDVLKGKSEEEILHSMHSMKDLDPNDLLYKSAKSGFLPGVNKALEDGADVHANVDYALRLASENSHYKIVKLLVD